MVLPSACRRAPDQLYARSLARLDAAPPPSAANPLSVTRRLFFLSRLRRQSLGLDYYALRTIRNPLCFAITWLPLLRTIRNPLYFAITWLPLLRTIRNPLCFVITWLPLFDLYGILSYSLRFPVLNFFCLVALPSLLLLRFIAARASTHSAYFFCCCKPGEVQIRRDERYIHPTGAATIC